jgi:hypothetical protein
MFDSIKSIIGDIASGASKDQRIALSQDQLVALDSKLKVLTEELAQSKSREAKLAIENADLRRELQHAQPVGFVESDGVMWKRTATGFESRPYCPECPSHPVMMGFPPREAEFWKCPKNPNHQFDYGSEPPAA